MLPPQLAMLSVMRLMLLLLLQSLTTMEEPAAVLRVILPVDQGCAPDSEERKVNERR